MNASVKQNPLPKRDFRGTLQNSAYDLQNFCTTIAPRHSSIFQNYRRAEFGILPARSSGSVLLTSLRNESFGRIEEAAAPEGLV